MRLLNNNTHGRLPRPFATLTMAVAILSCLALGVRNLVADGGGTAPGGGDAIGSLPFGALPPPEGLLGSQRPSIVFEAPNLALIQALVIDAWGDGYAEFTDLGTEHGVRVELQGQVSVLLDRNLVGVLPVQFGLDVSQGFAGGFAFLSQNQHVLQAQQLPAVGDLRLPLEMLSASAVLDHGALTLHSINSSRQHHWLDMTGSGGTLRLVSHQ